MEKDLIISPGLASTVIKWKVKPGQSINRGSILATYQHPGTETILKLKSEDVGSVVSMNIDEGKTVEPGMAAMVIKGCQHPTVMKQMCADCGADLKDVTQYISEKKAPERSFASVAMVHNIPELIISKEQAMELGKADEQRLLDQRKLVLLVDLDQTLIHTTNDNIPANLKDVYHFQLPHGRAGMMWYHTKFRPHTIEFLNRIAKLYELHICTFGVRLYAHTIAKFIDPDGKLFSHRILSRDECFSANSKTANLKALFPCGDSMVCIIDDREDVWNYVSNLVHVKPYMFFDATADINAPPGLSKSGGDGEEYVIHKRKEIVHKVPKGHALLLNGGSLSDANTTKDMAKVEDRNEKMLEHESVEESQAGKSLETGIDKITEEKTDGQSNSAEMVEKDMIDTSTVSSDSKQPADDTCCSDVEMKDDKQLSSTDEGTEKQGLKEHVTIVSDQEDKEDNSHVNIAAQDVDIETGDLCETPVHEDDGREITSAIVEGGTVSDPLSTPVGEVSEDGQKNKATVASENSSNKSNTEPSQCQPEQPQGEEATEREDNVTVEESNKPCEAAGMKGGEQQVSVSTDGKVQPSGQEESKNTDERGSETPVESTTSDIEYENIIEWEDDDDYLHYLEDVLTKVHKAFYEVYDQMKEQDVPKEVPDLKSVIPYVRRKVLKGANIVFSGLFPTNQSPQKSRAYRVAKSLGANIQLAFVEPGQTNATTHVVASKTGTTKVHQGQKSKSVHVVTAQWLWSCNDRWEWVDERVFPLSNKTQSRNVSDSPDISQIKKRKYPKEGNGEGSQNTDSGCDADLSVKKDSPTDPKPSTSKDAPNRRFSDTYNPLYAFSQEDIKNMDKEVEEIFDESSDSDNDSEADRQLREIVLGQKKQESSSEESLSGEYPLGWKRKRKRADLDEEEQTVEEPIAALAENPHRIFRFSDESSDSGKDDDDDYADSVGSIDEEMAAAVEKEFLA